ncbi:MAG: adenylyl-sulfate kinase [Patescibacteria group bacterium]
MLRDKRGAVLWFTGLSGSGKTTIAEKLVEQLQQKNTPLVWLDGDILRKLSKEFGLKDVGFSKEGRNQHVIRVGMITRLLSDQGIVTITTLISPYRKIRDGIRRRIGREFIEVFVNTPLEVCESRDPKGLYKKARAGEIKQFTGIDDPYEPPEKPEIVLCTDQLSIDDCVNKIIEFLNCLQ